MNQEKQTPTAQKFRVAVSPLSWTNDVLEDLGGVSHHDGGDHRQRMRAHRGDGGDVAGDAAGTGGVTGIEAHHASRGRQVLEVFAGGIGCDGVHPGVFGRGRFLGIVAELAACSCFSGKASGYNPQPL